MRNTELQGLSEQIENCYIQLDQQFQHSPVPEFGNRLTSSFVPFQDFSSLAIALEQIALEVQGRSAPYQALSLKDVTSEETALLEKAQQLGGVSAVARLPDALVVAATVDGFIGKVSYLSDLHPYHVFLDEAAYCPLIKAFTLFSPEVPITFLGDHKQLPPVCEADDRLFKQSEYMPIFLFAQSALYCESIFCRSFDQLFSEYIEASDFELHTMARFDLLHTFRFGESLAQVLARFVYTPEFRGNEAIQTNITILHAPHHKAEREKNTSLDEAKRISTYLQQNPCEDFAVITPYRNQKKQLVQHARGIYVLDRISTIHGSQGQEWDTVFFSVTAVSPNRFLSDTLINTAVSRAKKHLIIVCDRACWNRYPDSFLGSLISSGK